MQFNIAGDTSAMFYCGVMLPRQNLCLNYHELYSIQNFYIFEIITK